MGSDRGKREEQTDSKIPMKLHEEMGITKTEAYELWRDYQLLIRVNKNRKDIIHFLSKNYSVIAYFAALALEIVTVDLTTKAIIEGIKIDKETQA